MGKIVHGIQSFKKTGKIHPSLVKQDQLKRILNKTERALRAAAEPTIKNDILIDLIRLLKGDELDKGHMAGHDILRSVFSAVNSVGRLLDRVDWKGGKEAPNLEVIIAEIADKRKKGGRDDD